MSENHQFTSRRQLRMAAAKSRAQAPVSESGPGAASGNLASENGDAEARGRRLLPPRAGEANAPLAEEQVKSALPPRPSSVLTDVDVAGQLKKAFGDGIPVGEKPEKAAVVPPARQVDPGQAEQKEKSTDQDKEARGSVGTPERRRVQAVRGSVNAGRAVVSADVLTGPLARLAVKQPAAPVAQKPSAAPPQGQAPENASDRPAQAPSGPEASGVPAPKAAHAREGSAADAEKTVREVPSFTSQLGIVPAKDREADAGAPLSRVSQRVKNLLGSPKKTTQPAAPDFSKINTAAVSEKAAGGDRFKDRQNRRRALFADPATGSIPVTEAARMLGREPAPTSPSTAERPQSSPRPTVSDTLPRRKDLRSATPSAPASLKGSQDVGGAPTPPAPTEAGTSADAAVAEARPRPQKLRGSVGRPADVAEQLPARTPDVTENGSAQETKKAGTGSIPERRPRHRIQASVGKVPAQAAEPRPVLDEVPTTLIKDDAPVHAGKHASLAPQQDGGATAPKAPAGSSAAPADAPADPKKTAAGEETASPVQAPRDPVAAGSAEGLVPAPVSASRASRKEKADGAFPSRREAARAAIATAPLLASVDDYEPLPAHLAQGLDPLDSHAAGLWDNSRAKIINFSALGAGAAGLSTGVAAYVISITH